MNWMEIDLIDELLPPLNFISFNSYSGIKGYRFSLQFIQLNLSFNSFSNQLTPLNQLIHLFIKQIKLIEETIDYWLIKREKEWIACFFCCCWPPAPPSITFFYFISAVQKKPIHSIKELFSFWEEKKWNVFSSFILHKEFHSLITAGVGYGCRSKYISLIFSSH